MNDDELTLRRKRQSADRARAYRQRRKKDLDASPKLLYQKKLNAERCRRYRQKCKQLKLAGNCNQVTIDSDTSTSRDAVVARYMENNESIGLTAPVDCAVDGCQSSMRGNTNISFFNLPLDDQRRIAWAELIGRPDLADPTSKEKCYGVCSLHFDADVIHYIPTLKTNALPSKLLPQQSASTDSSLGTNASDYTYGTANDSAMEDIPMEASANIKYSRVPKPSQPTPEIKKEIESDNEEEVSSNQYSDYPQTEIALETVKVEYDIDIEDHFSESIAKKQILLDVNLIEDKEKSIIKSEPVDSQLQIEDKGDNYDGFGAYIATLLRALPPKKALAVQPKIVALIVSANIEDHQT